MASPDVTAASAELGCLHHPLLHLREDVESVLVLFLRNMNTLGEAASSKVKYQPSQLLTIAQAFFVLDVIEGSRGGCDEPFQRDVCTERDLYYRNPSLFGHQRSAHTSVERLCSWLDVGNVWAALVRRHVNAQNPYLRELFRKPQYVYTKLRGLLEASAAADAVSVIQPRYTRESLGITAAGKGTVAGALVMELCHPPERVDVSSCGAAGLSLTYSLVRRLMKCQSSPAAPAPSPSPQAAVPSALVVIEKESIFQAVLHSVEKCRGRLRRSFVFLCTKGYPCVASQHWLRRLHAVWPALELHILVDGDPHGLCIALAAMGLLGAHTRRGGSRRVEETLPFNFIGVCPSRVFGHGPTNGKGRLACPLHAPLPASSGTPLSHDDRQVLRRIDATLQNALRELSASSAAAAQAAAQTTRHTLEMMAREVEWIERSNVKCELQLACKAAESPLHFIEAHIP